MKLSPDTQSKLEKLSPEDREKVKRLAAEALLIHHLNQKQTEPPTSDAKRGYNCISAQLAWNGSDPTDDRIKSILAERAARLDREALNLTPKSEKV